MARVDVEQARHYETTDAVSHEELQSLQPQASLVGHCGRGGAFVSSASAAGELLPPFRVTAEGQPIDRDVGHAAPI